MFSLAEFVVLENKSHHKASIAKDYAYYQEVNEVLQEDLLLFDNSEFYVAVYDEMIIGSVKVTFWDGKTLLPMEKLFGIKCRDLPFADQLIWQVGRLAISKNNNTSGINLLKQLLTIAVHSICKYADSVMLAECDKKLLRILNLLGIRTETLAPGIQYLGSETIPIFSTHDWLSAFLKDNPYIDQIPEIGNKNNKFNVHQVETSNNLFPI